MIENHMVLNEDWEMENALCKSCWEYFLIEYMFFCEKTENYYCDQCNN